MWLLLIGVAVVLLSTRKAGARSPGASGTPTGPTLSPEQVAAGWQQSAGSSTVPQEIARGHQIAGGISGLAGAGAAAGAAAVLGLTAAAATGIGAIVAGAVILIDMLRGTAHLTANDFVKRFQNPFKDSLAQLIDPHDARMAAGTETLDEAKQTYTAIEFLWEQFQLAAHEYAQQSHDAQIVVDQGLHTLNGPNGLPGFPDGFITFMLTKLDGEINQLAGGNALSVMTGTF